MWIFLIFLGIGVAAIALKKPNPAIHRTSPPLTNGRRYFLRLIDLDPTQQIGVPEAQIAAMAGFSEPGATFVTDMGQVGPSRAYVDLYFDWAGSPAGTFTWDSPYTLVDYGSSLMAQSTGRAEYVHLGPKGAPHEDGLD
jgi:hypothetical protein